MTYQPKINAPRKLKVGINKYIIYKLATEGVRYSESQVLSKMATDAQFYRVVEKLDEAVKKTADKKKKQEIAQKIELARKKYLGDRLI